MLDVHKKCLCGSGMLYGDCCKKKPSLSREKSMQLIAETRKHYNNFQTPCIIPDSKGVVCKNKSIHSHNMQENGILNRLSVDGHVYVIRVYPVIDKKHKKWKMCWGGM